MPSWYDIKTLARGPGREDEGDIDVSAERIGALVDAEVERVGRSDRVVLLGFSQGAAMSLHVGARYPSRLAGIGCLSGYLVVPERLESERSAANEETPMFFGHGTGDPVVPLAGGRHAHARFTELGHPTVWGDWPMGHEVCLEELEQIRGWLNEVIPS